MKLKKWIVILFLLILLPCYFLAKTYASQGNPTDASDNFLGPTLNLNLGKVFGPIGLAGLVAYGPKQMRFNGTFGFEFGQNALNGIKFSAEYLRQKILYNFISGSTRQWVHQTAIGGAYNHIFSTNKFIKGFSVDSYYSNAPSIRLGDRSYFDPMTGTNLIDCTRRIAGARAFGFSTALNLLFFHLTNVGLALNYDNYKYNIDYLPSSDKNVDGFGATVNLMQPITKRINLDLSSSFRASFNQYQASLNWSPRSIKNLTLGLYGDYFDGSHQLISYSDVGLTISYLLNKITELNNPHPSASPNNPGHATPPNNPGHSARENHTNNQSPMDQWIIRPAVYMTQVLAIADKPVSSGSSICRTFTSNFSKAAKTIALDRSYRTLNVVVNMTSNPTREVTVTFKDAGNNPISTAKNNVTKGTPWTVPNPPSLEIPNVKTITAQITSVPGGSGNISVTACT